MVDIFSPSKRSKIMKNIRSKNTACELIVRKMIFAMGYRYRLHRADLPGKPDIVFSRFKKVIFIHGCFWHGCKKCSRSKLPESNKKFWRDKIHGNIIRDKQNYKKLRKLGWDSFCVWQCEIKKKNEDKLKLRIDKYLRDERKLISH